MNIYTLDVSKWRCGQNGPNELGEGNTSLLNKEGFMCCLGQFAKQKGVSELNLLDNGEPSDLQEGYDPLFVKGSKYKEDDTCIYDNTPLADHLMQINDDENSNVKDKIQAISGALKDAGCELVVDYGGKMFDE